MNFLLFILNLFKNKALFYFNLFFLFFCKLKSLSFSLSFLLKFSQPRITWLDYSVKSCYLLIKVLICKQLDKFFMTNLALQMAVFRLGDVWEYSLTPTAVFTIHDCTELTLNLLFGFLPAVGTIIRCVLLAILKRNRRCVLRVNIYII